MMVDSSFRQQRLKAWQPILTPATVLPTFLLVGILFVPLGGVLLYGSNQVSLPAKWRVGGWKRGGDEVEDDPRDEEVPSIRTAS
jgi:hypothetical protein